MKDEIRALGAISRKVAERSVLTVESTIPAARRIVPLRPVSCAHLCETTTRYDAVAKQLSFLMVCDVCGTEKLVETLPYEPRFDPRPTSVPARAATVHQLPVRRRAQSARRAA